MKFDRSTRAAGWLAATTAALLAACSSNVPLPPPEAQAPVAAQPPATQPPGAQEPIATGRVSGATNPRAYRQDGASH